MKKLFITALIAVSVATSAFADVNVNTLAVSHFKTDYQNATNVQWVTREDFTKVTFTLDGENMNVFYNNEGTVIASSKAIALDKLPASALRTITKEYPFPPYLLNECIEFTNAENEIKYYVSFTEEGKSKLILEISEKGSVNVYSKNRIN